MGVEPEQRIRRDMSGSEENPSLSVFFPTYNDAEGLPRLLERTFDVIPKLTSDYEVLVINDGSTDNTATVLESAVALYAPYLKIVTHETNRGYGAALRSGFASCTKDAVFYTDGDAQYDIREIEQLWKKFRPGVDLVNGYKLNRADGWMRALAGTYITG
jgi:glycosyltransferase involved in cell wall biosynthesis